MKKTVYIKIVCLLLSLVVGITSAFAAVQPDSAQAKTKQESGNVEISDPDAIITFPENKNDTPPSVTDVVYDKEGNIMTNGQSDDEAARLLAEATFSGTNLALNAPAFSSGNEVDYLTPDLAVDGKGNTRWSSAIEDDQWFYVDLGEKKSFDRVVIRWQTPADTYKILVSDDAQTWVNVKDNDGIIQCKGAWKASISLRLRLVT